MTQRDVVACECGGLIRYCATDSPWEFEGRCGTCQRGVVTSWAHASAPPIFVPEGAQKQADLFSEANV